MFTISKQFSFSASHQLQGLPDNRDGTPHQCTRLHGHNYLVELILSSPVLDKHGMVVDYNDMKPFQQYIDEQLDHRHLNEVLPGLHPTAEHLAKHLYDVASSLLPHVHAVRVSETAKTWAEYRHE